MYLAAQNTTQVFTLFGGAYVQEQHDQGFEYPRHSIVPEPSPADYALPTKQEDSRLAV